MRLLLDTNVLLAAFVARGLCHELLEHCERHHHLVTSEWLLKEFRGKLEQKFRVPPQTAADATALLRVHSEVVEPQPLPKPTCRDPDDDWVLASAAAGACDFIVTGDKDLLDLAEFQGTPIITPRAFWALESSRRHPA